MKRGQTIQVFEDPITREVLEGEAILQAKYDVEDDENGLERWAVLFPGDTLPVVRWVHRQGR